MEPAPGPVSLAGDIAIAAIPLGPSGIEMREGSSDTSTEYSVSGPPRALATFMVTGAPLTPSRTTADLGGTSRKMFIEAPGDSTMFWPSMCRKSSATWTLLTTFLGLAIWQVMPADWRFLPHPIYWTWLVSLTTLFVVPGRTVTVRSKRWCPGRAPAGSRPPADRISFARSSASDSAADNSCVNVGTFLLESGF